MHVTTLLLSTIRW